MDRQLESRAIAENVEGPPLVTTRMDTHCHSHASNKPVIRALGAIDMPECFSPPEKVYDQARARGMDLVTITDHDTIRGALELHERGFEGFVIGQEVSVRFPEDRCLLHVLTWGLTPELAEEIDSIGLRDDVYHFAYWLFENNLPHALAHPLYVQNGKLTEWHLERCLLLFKGWETLNGAHSGTHRGTVERYLRAFTPKRTQELTFKHQLEPMWSRIWQKGRTGGSDDHGLLNIGRTYTSVSDEERRKITDPAEFLRRVVAGHGEPGGVAGHSSLLAHQLATVGAQYYAERLHAHADPVQQRVGATLARFAGVDSPSPSKASLIAHRAKQRVLRGRKGQRPLPLLDALKSQLGPILEKYPDLKACLDPDSWDDGAPISQHERMAEFTEDLAGALGNMMATGAINSLRDADRAGIADHLLSYLLVNIAQLPYLFSLFHQNKERPMLEKLDHDLAARTGESGASVLDRPMRVALFTDTLGDVNGVCRFIQNVAYQANQTDRDLQVITSTTFPTPEWDNIHNFEPVFATKMPKYEQLEVVLPPLMKILRYVDRHQPDAIHISTPGPVGMIGYIAGKMLRVPVLGVYHTDFPAYVDHLFDDHAFTWICSEYMKFFYRPFSAIFTRSADYVDSLVDLSMPREKIVRLMPGLETSRFNTSYQDRSIWNSLAAEPGAGLEGLDDPDAIKVLYVGRVSIEKNLPMLTKAWSQVHKRAAATGKKAHLVVVGDGPYRSIMDEELRGMDVHFLGFRHARELSTIYASSDMFVFPSLTDTLGQVVMESQSSGLPVIVSDEGGPKEVVEDGRTGFVLPGDRSGAWVDAMVRLITDDDRRVAMGQAAAESMKPYDIRHSFEHFWDVHAEAWHEHLRQRGITPHADARAEPASASRAPDGARSDAAAV